MFITKISTIFEELRIFSLASVITMNENFIAMKTIIIFLTISLLSDCSVFLPDSFEGDSVPDNELGGILFINEVSASNPYEDDWVELYNASAVTVTLDGMYLSDDLTVPSKWQFPTGTSIPPDGHLLVWCDGDSWQGSLHASFKLGRGGEEIGLFDSLAHGLVPLDWIIFGPQQEDVSYGRQSDGADHWEFLDPPTPGMSND